MSVKLITDTFLSGFFFVLNNISVVYCSPCSNIIMRLITHNNNCILILLQNHLHSNSKILSLLIIYYLQFTACKDKIMFVRSYAESHGLISVHLPGLRSIASLTLATFSGILPVFVGSGGFFIMDPVSSKICSHLRIVQHHGNLM